jgi:hypothetical protein
MKAKIKWIRIINIIGIIALIAGAIDPMEGSVIIAAGSALIALSTFLTRDHHWKIFLASFLMIIIGVFFLFYLSALGGIGGNSKLSWWWGLLALPYPIGWLASIVLLIMRAIRKKKLPDGKPLDTESYTEDY